MINFLLYKLLFHLVIPVKGLVVTLGLENFSCFDAAVLHNLLPSLFSQFYNIQSLLRIQRTRDYGLTELIETNTSRWSHKVLKKVLTVIEGRPHLQSMLLTSLGAWFIFHHASIFLLEEWKSRLTILPNSLEGPEDTKTLAAALPVIDQIDMDGSYRLRGSWRIDDLSIFFLLNEPEISQSGFLHRLLFTTRSEVLMNSQKHYLSLIDSIVTPREIASHLAFILLKRWEWRGMLLFDKDKDTLEGLTNAICTLRLRWGRLKSKYELDDISSPEFLRLHVCLELLKHDTPKRTLSNKLKDLINQHLASYNAYDKLLLLEILSKTMYGECAKIISLDNRHRLLDLHITDQDYLFRCLTRKERISYFFRWERRLAGELALDYNSRSFSISHGLSQVYNNAAALPYEIQGTSSKQWFFLAQQWLIPRVQGLLLWQKAPKSQLTTISVRNQPRLLQPFDPINNTTLIDYLFVVAIRQIYFQAPLRFSRTLARQVILTNRDYDTKETAELARLIGILHPNLI